jgi:uncharacterized protein (TIGR02099 family)
MLMLKTFLRRVRTLLWTAFSIIVIVLAVGVGVGKLLMPYSVHYQPELEQWLSNEFGQEVTLDSFEGEWTAFGPRLVLHGLRLPRELDGPAAEAGEAVIESAALDVRPLSYLLAGRPLYNFRLIGADFELERSMDGVYSLSGFGVTARAGEGSVLSRLARLGEVVLEDSSLQYHDAQRNVRLAAARINGRLVLDGDRLAASVEAYLYDRRSQLEYGEMRGTLALSFDDEQKVVEADWHANGQRLMLASFQGKVPESPFLPLTGWLSGEVWGGWSRGAGHRVNGDVNLLDALIASEQADFDLSSLDARFRWRFRGEENWNLHLADFRLERDGETWNTPRLSLARNVEDSIGLWISADELPLGAPLNITRDIMSVYGKGWPDKLPARGDGEIRDLDLVLNPEWDLRLVRGRIRNASVAGNDRWPGLQGLNADIDMQGGSGLVRMAGEQVTVDWPRMFREPLGLRLPECLVEVEWGEHWRTRLRGCALENADAAISGDILLLGNEGKPVIDANLRVLRANVGRLDPYWPEATMPDTVKEWLRRALLAGEVRTGRALIRGDLDDFPFRNGGGRFEAVAWIEDVELKYLEDWPGVSQVSAVARFVGPSFEAVGQAGDTAGSAVDFVHARIRDMKQAELEVEYRTESDLPALLDFVQQTPLQRQVGIDLEQFEFTGSASVTGAIRAPLGSTPGELSVDGTVELDGAGFREPRQEITIEEVAGAVRYSERGFSGADLDAFALGSPASLDIMASADGREKFRAAIQGNFPARDVLTDEDLRKTLGLLEGMDGSSDWTIALEVAADGSDREASVDLVARSDLVGVSLGLPPPFDKAPAEPWPFELNYPLDGSGRPLDILISDRAAIRLMLPAAQTAPSSVLINLDGRLAALPPEGRVRIEGHVDRLDGDGWVRAIIEEIGRGAGMAGLELERSELVVNELLFLDRLFADVELVMDLQESDLRTVFRSNDIDGTVRFRAFDAGPGSLSAEFERLSLGAPQSSGMRLETNPKDLPALHLFARSFAYHGVELGETRIEAFPTADGLRFEMVDAHSDAISVQASGDWVLAEDGHRSDFRINMTSESLGDFLASMDITPSVEGGQTMVKFNAWWHGTPGLFALSRLNGQLDFSVVGGTITGADAGAGRLLGLVSFTALPKRLALDFRDVFESGFHFDEAGGSFTLENGVASTENMFLKSSSASIDVTGRTDLVERQYDQLITIRPGVGNTLPIIGALAGGPGGAAAGLALQGLLHESLAEATKVRYAISGSWDEPEIEPVEVERAGG